MCSLIRGRKYKYRPRKTGCLSMADAQPGKGGNRGRAPKFSTKPALTPSGDYFSHSKPLQPLSGREIPLGAKYRR